MRERYYPRADWRIQNFAVRHPGSRMNPNVLVLHTTETGTWPGYKEGATAPHLTVLANTATKRLEFRQHFPFDVSARALRNEPGGVETNTLNAVQVELIGSCDPKGGIALGRFDWTDPPDWALRGLAEFVAWFDAEWPDFRLRDAAPRGWLPYPASYGNRNGQRMTAAEWKNAYGIVGHQHVPENSHGDPGDFPIERLLMMARPEAPVDPNQQYAPIVLTIGTFNNKGYRPMTQEAVNKGDYVFRDLDLDLYGEQERWVPGQLGGHRKIFPGPIYVRHDPLASSGTIAGHRASKFKRLANFRIAASKAVLGVCGGRKFTGEVLEFVEAPGATLTHFSLHTPPKAWSNALNRWPRRKAAAQREWRRAIETAKGFAERQIRLGGRDFVVIETDANAGHERLREAFGDRIAGKRVHIFTSPDGYKIDHVIVIGEVGKVVWQKTGDRVPSDHRPFAVRLWLRVPVKG